MLIAITRAVSPNIGQCELTHLDRQPIDLALAQTQHRQYEAALETLGCQLVRLPAEPTLPDSVFVEDTAIVLDEIAILTRPGADSRKAETASIAQALAPYRTVQPVVAPAVVDGGDILRIGKRLYVGLSSRSNEEAVAQMAHLLRPFGYSVQGVQVHGCLHLKSAVTQVAPAMLLVNPAWVDAGLFGDMQVIEVDATEPHAANALLIDGTIVYPTCYPATRQRLALYGVPVQEVDVSELIKAEGAVTCCSLVFNQ